MPGVTVTARNEGTGLTRTAGVSSANGEYTINQLPPGTYTLSAELSGFRKAVFKSVAVNVGTRRPGASTWRSAI